MYFEKWERKKIKLVIDDVRHEANEKWEGKNLKMTSVRIKRRKYD